MPLRRRVPASGYFYFFNQKMHALKKNSPPNLEHRELQAMMAAHWKCMGKAEKYLWTDAARKASSRRNQAEEKKMQAVNVQP